MFTNNNGIQSVNNTTQHHSAPTTEMDYFVDFHTTLINGSKIFDQDMTVINCWLSRTNFKDVLSLEMKHLSQQ